MARKIIDQIKLPTTKHELRDPVTLYNLIQKIIEIIDEINGRKAESKTSESLGASEKR